MIELELLKKIKQFVCTVTNSVVMDYCGENSWQIVRTLYSQLCGHWSNSCLYRHHFGQFVTLHILCVCVCVRALSHSLVVAWRF